jgi:ribosomal protein S21
MATNIEVSKTGNENNGTLLKRFTKKMQEAGVLPRVRSIRYNERVLSTFKVKKARLKSISRKAEIEKLIKLGKQVENKRRRR